MAIKCPICGEKNPDDADKCKACGALLEEPSEKKVKPEKILIAIFIFALLIIVAIIAAPIIYKSVPANNHKPDSDGDGMPDSWETENNLNPNDPNDRNEDPDEDGLINFEEYKRDTDPHNPDTDGDGVPDGLDLIPRCDAGIQVIIETLRIKDPVDLLGMKDPGEIFFKIYIDDEFIGEVPDEPEELEIDRVYDVNWSIQYNVSDDKPSYKIRIEMYDKDTIREELLDINGVDPSKDKSGYYLEINYYLGTDDVGREQPGSSDGSDDGNTGLHDDKDGMIEYKITTVDMLAI
ncbi:MAG: hypothetical protein U9O96_01735 [Candidatus Thermoplasmatota archaeon]|nr:hypothetical protein [Candidatus Thermoplasmatota archaeon]